MCFLSSRFHIWWRGCGLLWSTICSHVLNLGFDFLLFSGVIWSPPLCFLKIIGTSELILDHNLYPVPRFGLLFSFVFWAPCVTYVGEGWVHASVLFSASIASGASFTVQLRSNWPFRSTLTFASKLAEAIKIQLHLRYLPRNLFCSDSASSTTLPTIIFWRPKQNPKQTPTSA